ncbi:MFS transporter [Aestuariimicrobium sp. Y1814]|uniref:MFS transporter n=1 Tax=Aestuariimicrobium sp. Y1814 TaxID=3418742 RepID=UPI003DA7A6A4
MTQTSERPPRAGVVSAIGWAFFPIAFMARLPYAMMVVGNLTLVVAARDSLALGGAASAAVGIGTALFGPLIGAAADRFGQRPVLITSAIASGALLALLAWVAYSPLPDVAILATALAIGAFSPQVGPMSRTRLGNLILSRAPREFRERALNGAMAYESMADEINFVIGPVLVGLVAALIHPAAPLVLAAVLSVVFVGAFALHPSAPAGTRHDEARAEVAPARELLAPGLLLAVLGTFGVGLFFGATLTSLTSAMGDLGSSESAGIVYGAMGLGSAIFAIGVIWLPANFTLAARWISFAAVMLLGVIGYALAGLNLTWIVVALLVAGCGVGPTLVTLFGIGVRLSPKGRSATAMTMLGSGVIVGQSLASAVTGAIGQAHGSAVAMWLPTVAATLVVIAGLANMAVGRRR